MLSFSPHEFLSTTGQAFLLYAGRFFALAALFFWLLDPSRRRPLGRADIPRPEGFRLMVHLRREAPHSLMTAAVFAVVIGSLFGSGFVNLSLAYFNLDDYPLWWFWLSIPVQLLLHDTLFYWLHRAMHSRWLFQRVHRLHHESVYPTAFAAYSLSLAEAILEALAVVAIIFIVPVHPTAFLIFQTLSAIYGIYGHSGRELYPPDASRHWLMRWLNRGTLHAYHHRHARGNYGFYFAFWDWACGTLVIPQPQPPRGTALTTAGVASIDRAV